MINECYLAVLKKTRKEHPEAEFIAVTRTSHSILAPSKKLLKDYKKAEKKLGNRWKVWHEVDYESRYKKEILNNQDALAKIKEIAMTAKKKDVYLVCYEKEPPCHRFILLEMIKCSFLGDSKKSKSGLKHFNLT